MSHVSGGTPAPETAVTVRYWAGARAAAGVAEDVLAVDGPITLAEVVRRVLEARPGDRMASVVGVCSVLVGDQPVGGRDPGGVLVQPGSTVELLPPFAGG
jgi:molybdopterin converting factor small subunit